MNKYNNDGRREKLSKEKTMCFLSGTYPNWRDRWTRTITSLLAKGRLFIRLEPLESIWHPPGRREVSLPNQLFFAQLPWPRLLEVYAELEQERFRQFLRLSQVSLLVHISQWIEFSDRSVCTTHACTNVCSSNQPVTTFDQTLGDSKFPGCSRSLVMN